MSKVAIVGVDTMPIRSRLGFICMVGDLRCRHGARTSRPGRAPVCWSSRTIGTPDTSVAL